MGAGAVKGLAFVAVYGRAGSLIEMRDLLSNKVSWTAPLIPPVFAPRRSAVFGSELDRVEIAPDGRFLVSYQSPIADDPVGDSRWHSNPRREKRPNRERF